MSIIPVNKSLGVDIQDILTGYTTIMTMSQDSGGNKFRRNSTLHLLCSNITKFFTLHPRAENGSCTKEGDWDENDGGSLGIRPPSTFRTNIFGSSFPENKIIATVKA
jgi:hypothetical protein